MTSLVERTRSGPVEVLTPNRPEASNALSPELLAELGTALDEALADDGARVVVLPGAGDRAFCAGKDLRAFGEAPAPRRSSLPRSLFGVLRSFGGNEVIDYPRTGDVEEP